MSKVAAVALAVSGTAVITVGSVLLFKGKGQSGEETSSVTATPTINWFENVEAFKNGVHQSSDCIKDYFGSINVNDKSESSSEISTSNVPDGTFFDNSALTESDKSCLKVQWKKTTATSDGNKWKGKFTWLWTFLKGDTGFINFNVAETSTTEVNKLQVTGAFYLLKKENEAWTIKHKKEVATTPVTIGTNDWDTKFPKKHTELSAGGGVDDHWGFVSASSDLSNVCSDETSCPNLSSVEPTTQVFTFAWTPSGSGTNKKLNEWSSVDTWWSSIYGTDWNLKDKIQNFQGAWTFQQSPS